MGEPSVGEPYVVADCRLCPAFGNGSTLCSSSASVNGPTRSGVCGCWSDQGEQPSGPVAVSGPTHCKREQLNTMFQISTTNLRVCSRGHFRLNPIADRGKTISAFCLRCNQSAVS